MKKLIILLLFIPLVFSCKNDDDIQQEIYSNPLIGQWIINSAKKPPSSINNFRENSISISEFCKIHSIIFFENSSFKMYTLNDNSICNYVILGNYVYNINSKQITLSVSENINGSLVNKDIGQIENITIDSENGKISGSFNFPDLCVDLDDGYQQKEYTFSLTYIPDDNLEQYLIDIGKDDVLDDYVLSQSLSTIGQLSINAVDKFQDDPSIDFYDFENRFENRLTNLAGVEEFTSLLNIQLNGHNLDSINISKNTSLVQFFAQFNTFKKINTDNNPNLVAFAIGANEVTPQLNFDRNTKLERISLGDVKIDGSIGDETTDYFSLKTLENLEFLDLNSCISLKSIDISNNYKLIELRANFNSLISIDLSKNDSIKHLYLGSNKLKKIDISNLINLETLFIYNNDLKEINLQNNKNLKQLHIQSNDLQGTLDVSMIDNLRELEVEGGNTSLTCIKVNQNQLDNLVTNWKVPSFVSLSTNCD
tara:strand:- start:1362 stop:2801 length:1440 start_codon:yes stop_codon:yes gene_type:complete